MLIVEPRRTIGEALARSLRRCGFEVAVHTSWPAEPGTWDGGVPTAVVVAVNGTSVADGVRVLRRVAPRARVVLLADDPADGRIAALEPATVLSVDARVASLAAALDGDRPADLDGTGDGRGRTVDGRGSTVATVGSWNTPDTRLVDELTPREREVLRLLAAGLTRAGIGERLGISPGTVRSHLQSIFAKLGAHSRLEAVAVGLRAGLRPPATADHGGAGGTG